MSNKLTLILLFLFLSSLHCIGQEQVTPFPVVAKWSIGDNYNFNVTKKHFSSYDNIYEKDSTSYIANFEIIGITDTTYLIKWSYETNLSAFGVPDTFANEFSKYAATDVIYTTNRNGAFVGIENWEEISSSKIALLNEVLNTLVENQHSTIRGSKIRDLKIIYESKDYMEFNGLKEIAFLHNLFDTNYHLSDTIISNEVYNFKFLKYDIEGIAKTYVDSVNVDKSFLKIIKKLVFNPDFIKNLLYELRSNKKIRMTKKVIKASQWIFDQTFSYEFNTEKTIPIKIEVLNEQMLKLEKRKSFFLSVCSIKLID